MSPYRRYGLPVLAILFLFAGGLLSGTCTGERYLSGLVTGRVTSALFYFRPAVAYPLTLAALNSREEGERMAGYYALLDNHVMDYSFLKERFTLEESPVIRRTILWIMGRGGDVRDILSAYDSLYDGASKSERDEMVRGLERFPDALKDFTERHRITLPPDE